jgi:hypothetical protein
MLPRTLPTGTTLRSLIEVLLPGDHRASVPSDAGDATFGLRLAGGPAYVLEAKGNALTVTEVARLEGPSLLLSTDEATAQVFLDDWMGTQRLAPKFEPRGLAAMTDPRMIRRVCQVKGVITLTLEGMPELGGRPATLFIAAGPDANLYDDPDVTVRIGAAAFEKMLSGALTPDAAISGGHVALTGKKLVAMQFALAILPYFPQG